MIDFFLGIFSTMFQMNMRDHHDMPFAMPLMMACLVGGLVGYIIVKFVVKEQRDDAIEQTKSMR